MLLLYYKYQLSLIDPRDKIMLYTELYDLCDELQCSSVGARRYYHLSQAKLMTRSTIDIPKQNKS